MEISRASWLALLIFAVGAGATAESQHCPSPSSSTGLEKPAASACRVDAALDSSCRESAPLQVYRDLSPALLEPAAAPQCRAEAAGDPSPLTGAAMQVYRDPVTGRFTAPPIAARVLLPRALEVQARPQVQERAAQPGGGVRVDFSGGFATALVISRGEDGRLRTECSHDHHPPLEHLPPAEGNDR